MKAIIYNSGLGKRMCDLTKNCHKSMVKLENGETIYERQLRILNKCGIKEVIVTVGPFKEQLIEVSKKEIYKNMSFTFVENQVYQETNYIYSMYLAKNYLNDDVLSLHGDLVFDEGLLRSIIRSPIPSLGLCNPKKKLPEKDFKGRVKDGKIMEVSINIFDNNCFAFQPLYKFSKQDINKWVEKVIEYIESGNNKVYAENALNELLPSMDIKAVSYEEHYIDEIDTPEDLKRVSMEIVDYEKAFKSINKDLKIVIY